MSLRIGPAAEDERDLAQKGSRGHGGVEEIQLLPNDSLSELKAAQELGHHWFRDVCGLSVEKVMLASAP